MCFRSVAAALALSLIVFLPPIHAQGDAQAATTLSNLSKLPTPRAADGHPDLTGMWVGGPPPQPVGAGRVQAPPSPTDGAIETVSGARDGSIINLEEDGYVMNHATQNKPWYKPEYWERVRHLNAIGYRTKLDPGFSCNDNPGLTRLGPPVETVQFPDKLLLIYQTPGDGGNVATVVREIPTDGRPLPSPDDYEGTKIMGTSVGHWEGDTLVIQTVDIAADASWLGYQGWIHSGSMHVTEKIMREGNVLTVDMTVEDPDMLLRPWVLPTERATLNSNPKTVLRELNACVENDADHIVGTQ